MGFALAEITSRLNLRTRGSCEATREVAVAILKVIDNRIQNLTGLRDELATLAAECGADANDANCPIL